MRASLDTNVIIHLYRAGRQHVLFELFDEGVFIYEQIRTMELQNHAKDLIPAIDFLKFMKCKGFCDYYENSYRTNEIQT